MSTKAKKLTDFIESDEKPELKLVQAKVPAKLHADAKAKLDAKNLTWNDVIVAALKMLVAENP